MVKAECPKCNSSDIILFLSPTPIGTARQQQYCRFCGGKLIFPPPVSSDKIGAIYVDKENYLGVENNYPGVEDNYPN